MNTVEYKETTKNFGELNYGDLFQFTGDTVVHMKVAKAVNTSVEYALNLNNGLLYSSYPEDEIDVISQATVRVQS